MNPSDTLEPPSSDRRSFLKLSGAAVLAASISEERASALIDTQAPQQPAATAAAAEPVLLVNLLQGTDSTFNFSRGNTLPIAALPFGMAHWTLQSFSGTTWMFHPEERRIQGFRCTHQLAPWLGDYGQAVFLPFSGRIDPDPGRRAASYRPEEAVLRPHTMSLHLMRDGIDAELIPTERCALISARYRAQDGCGFLVDIPKGKSENVEQDPANGTIRFTSTINSGGVSAGFANYYLLKFSTPWTRVEMTQSKEGCVFLVHLPPGTKALEVRIATSFISFDQAALNLNAELGGNPPQALRDKGAAVWNKHLGRVEIAGATPEQQKTFYSCLYRTLLFPRVWHEPDATGKMQHRSPYNGQVVEGVMYADHGYWDVYRAWYPMMTILYPDRLGEILQGWVNAYKEGGWLPQFPCPGYRGGMTGSLIDSVFGEAAAKSIQGFDLKTAYEGLKKHATEPADHGFGYGRRGVLQYMKYHYLPQDLVGTSVVETMDAAYGDFCISQVAKALGNQDDYAMFRARSESWRNLFDSKTGFLRAKRSDGTWVEPFDPIAWGNPYVEGSAWQHRWAVPHNIPGLVDALGGGPAAVAQLEEMCTMQPDFHLGDYNSEIHEMSEMAAVNFGQYAHSNQPVHHVLGIFAIAGRPDRTRYWTRKVMDELYSSNHFAGDEDTGSMSAWYVLNALGLFALCPAKPEYVVSAPLFERATVNLSNNKTLTITQEGTGNNVSAIVFNGAELRSPTIEHAALTGGGHLLFHRDSVAQKSDAGSI